MKSIVILATTHENQIVGNARSSGLEQRVDYFKSKLGVQIVMEEWSKKKGKSAAETFTNKSGFPWANVGTPDEPQFRTYRGPVNYPGYDGTVPSDPDAPPLRTKRPAKIGWQRMFNRRWRNIRPVFSYWAWRICTQ
jgi:hypothetical protein